MVAKRRKSQCLVPGCKCPQAARGMCATCYRRALRFIANSDRTWDYFEGKGWAREKKKQGRPLTNNLDKALKGDS